MVTGAYHPELSGGGLQCQAIVDALGSEIAFAVLATCTDPSLPSVDEVDGTPVRRVSVDVTSRRSRLDAAVAFTRAFFALSSSFDLVHLHGFSQKSALAVLLAKLLGKPVVVTMHTAGQDEPAGVRTRSWLGYRAYRSADLRSLARHRGSGVGRTASTFDGSARPRTRPSTSRCAGRLACRLMPH